MPASRPTLIAIVLQTASPEGRAILLASLVPSIMEELFLPASDNCLSVLAQAQIIEIMASSPQRFAAGHGKEVKDSIVSAIENAGSISTLRLYLSSEALSYLESEISKVPTT